MNPFITLRWAQEGIPWQTSSWDLALSPPWPWIKSLVGKLDPTSLKKNEHKDKCRGNCYCFFKFYIFIFGCAWSLLLCGPFYSWREWDTLVAVHGLRSWDSRALEHRFSGWVYGLPPWQVGSSWIRDRTSVSWILAGDSLPPSHQGSPLCCILSDSNIYQGFF